MWETVWDAIHDEPSTVRPYIFLGWLILYTLIFAFVQSWLNKRSNCRIHGEMLRLHSAERARDAASSAEFCIHTRQQCLKIAFDLGMFIERGKVLAQEFPESTANNAPLMGLSENQQSWMKAHSKWELEIHEFFTLHDNLLKFYGKPVEMISDLFKSLTPGGMAERRREMIEATRILEIVKNDVRYLLLEVAK